MTDLPLWISTDQAERLKKKLEGNGFENVRIEPEGEDEIRVTASDGGAEHFVRVGQSNLLTSVVWQFKRWRENRRG